jgi:hypothetical protein
MKKKRLGGVLDQEKFDLDKYLQEDLDYQEDKDEKLEASKLESEIQHLRQWMVMYGFPTFGNIMPGCTLDDTRQTVKAIKAVLNKRKEDMEFKTSIRNTLNDQNNKTMNLEQENDKLQEKADQLLKKLNYQTNQFKQSESNWKTDREGYTSDLEELRKANLKLKHQVAQYQHEHKKMEQQNEKLKDQIKKKIFDKDMNVKNTIEMTKPIYMNGPLIYVNKSGENEFTYLVTKANQEVQNSLKSENSDLKECIKMLQNELLEIVQVKTEHFGKRYNTEYQKNLDKAMTEHDIQPLNTDLVNMPFEHSGKTILTQFQENIRRLRDFLTRVDKDMKDVFEEEGEDYGEGGEFANFRTVSQLRHLLKNYKALTEAQEAVIQGDLVNRSKVPPPDEIITPNSRFRIISDREIEYMKNNLQRQKMLLDKDQNEIEVKKEIIRQKSSIRF